ncbi:MAG: DNA polymerase IV [Desulfobacterales bacterium]|nr:DNA polymerase IV [Desulfobacterales bacterium]
MILHIDMDAFFASVEQLDNPDLVGKPVVVGWQSNRGVVAAASYEARKYGIHSAMPIFMAKKKCRNLIIVSPQKGRYSEVSREVMSILKEFTHLVEPVSIDEAYMDVKDCEKLHGSPKEIALKIKKKIKEEVKLTCSVGIAPLRFLAKIASDLNKPDGLSIIYPDEVHAFINTLPIKKVPGVGDATYFRLEALGIRTLGDIRKFSEDSLTKKFGKFGRRLFELSQGIDRSKVIPYTASKSVSSEETLEFDTLDKVILSKFILEQSEDVGKELRKIGMRAKTITLKIKMSDFTQITRSCTISKQTQSSEIIFQEASRLLEKCLPPKKIRLIGVGASGLISETIPVQQDLFAPKTKDDQNWEKINHVVDAISQKFGNTSIKKASLTEKEDKEKNNV